MKKIARKKSSCWNSLCYYLMNVYYFNSNSAMCNEKSFSEVGKNVSEGK